VSFSAHPIRNVMRVVGPVMVVVGLFILGSFVYKVSAAFGKPSLADDEVPNFFWPMIGVPLLGVGGVITERAFLGKSARYFATETAPAVEITNRAARQGWTEDARPLARSRICPACERANALDAQFCDRCGQALVA